jgi:hypothetical protein
VRKNFLAKIPCNPLISLISDERIQGNPRKGGTGSGPPLGIWSNCGERRVTRDRAMLGRYGVVYLYFDEDYIILPIVPLVASSILYFGSLPTVNTSIRNRRRGSLRQAPESGASRSSTAVCCNQDRLTVRYRRQADIADRVAVREESFAADLLLLFREPRFAKSFGQGGRNCKTLSQHLDGQFGIGAKCFRQD